MPIAKNTKTILVLVAVSLIIYSLTAIFSGSIFGTKFQNCPNPLFPCQSSLTVDPQFINHAMPLIMLMAIALAMLVFALTADTAKTPLTQT